MKVNLNSIKSFQNTVWDYYHKHKRNFEWRKTDIPYHIVVSEIMLQQTQVSRVAAKYPVFITRFPDFKTLASSSTHTLLSVWQGMGYNRRALYLREIAGIIYHTYGGVVPKDKEILDSFPGIGAATAASIIVFSYNIPLVFIETNIRRVFIHHFFKDGQNIDDKALYPLVQASLDIENPREWYFALMDYGSYLGRILDNPNKRSKHYVVQSSFEGSDRQIRSAIIRLLLKKPYSRLSIVKKLKIDAKKVTSILEELLREGFVVLREDHYTIL